jgi:hypothetical protein
MSIDPVKIPQNVYVEDRIIGPVTLRQIIIVLISAGFSYALWSTMKAAGSVSAIGTALAWMPTAIGVAFAFVKINDISLLRLCLLVIERIEKPSVRYWTPRTGITINIRTKQVKQKNSQPEKNNTTSMEQLSELSSLLDKGPESPTEMNDAEDNQIDTPEESENEQTSRPVNPKKVSAEPLNGMPMDTIQKPLHTEKPRNANLFQDIQPPQ